MVINKRGNMSYLFMSNIKNFDSINNPDEAYQTVDIGDTINFIDDYNNNRKASFLMIRAHRDNDILIQILPYNYGVLIPATEMWSVDSLKEIEGITIKQAFNPIDSSSINTNCKIQWMIGYK